MYHELELKNSVQNEILLKKVLFKINEQLVSQSQEIKLLYDFYREERFDIVSSIKVINPSNYYLLFFKTYIECNIKWAFF